jgi:hypothetical protein
LDGFIEDKGSYKQFKKVNPAFGASQGGGQSNQGHSEQTMSRQEALYIIQMLEELTGRREVPEVPSRQDQPVSLMQDDPFGGMGI